MEIRGGLDADRSNSSAQGLMYICGYGDPTAWGAS